MTTHSSLKTQAQSMKTHSSSIIPLIVTGYLATTTGLLAQGSLTPPGPPAPTMKSLSQIEPRTPILSLPFTITNAGSYYLTTNLTGVSGTNGITIAANNVALDLNGFALLGVPGSIDAIIVETSNQTNLIVRNGNVSGWGGGGVFGNNAYNSLCEHVTVSDCAFDGITLASGGVSDCTVSSCGGTAINVALSGTVTGCSALSCGANGITVSSGTLSGCIIQACSNYAVGGFTLTVSGCTVANCSLGIDVTQGTVSGCTVYQNAAGGIYLASGTVSGCVFKYNGASGIYAGGNGNGRSVVVGNTCIGNNTSGNTADAGIVVFNSNNRVEDNNVVGNGYAGIAVSAAEGGVNNVIIRNTVSGNGTNNYVVPGSQIVGPLITTAGTITNSNPWANFSF